MTYDCPCGWSRIVLDGETVEDAKRIHQSLPIHRLSACRWCGQGEDAPRHRTTGHAAAKHAFDPIER